MSALVICFAGIDFVNDSSEAFRLIDDLATSDSLHRGLAAYRLDGGSV